MYFEPKEYSEEEIQALVDSAVDSLYPAMGGREGPFWGQRVYFYTDYDNDDVRTFGWVDLRPLLKVLERT